MGRGVNLFPPPGRNRVNLGRKFMISYRIYYDPRHCRTRYGRVLLTVSAAQDNYKVRQLSIFYSTILYSEQGKVHEGYWMMLRQIGCRFRKRVPSPERSLVLECCVAVEWLAGVESLSSLQTSTTSENVIFVQLFTLVL